MTSKFHYRNKHVKRTFFTVRIRSFGNENKLSAMTNFLIYWTRFPTGKTGKTPVAFHQLLPPADIITHTALQNRGMLITKNRLIIPYAFHICILYVYWRGLVYIFLTICEVAMSFRTWVATFTSHFLNWRDSVLHWTSSLKDFLTHRVLAVLKDKGVFT